MTSVDIDTRSDIYSLEALRKAAAIRPSLELRNEAIACLALADLRVARDWFGVKPQELNGRGLAFRFAVNHRKSPTR